MRRLLAIFAIVWSCASFLDAQTERMQVDCGSWITLTATPFDDYYFIRWSDGNTDSVRSVQVNEDVNYIAYFGEKCRESASWPVVALYDWLIMLNVNAINNEGYFFGPENVNWYRVVGEPDDFSAGQAQDDQLVVSGSYYLTLNQNLQGTGDYYAIVDISSNPSGRICTDYMRSEIIHFSSAGSPARRPMLLPSVAPAGTTMRLVGLAENELTTITVVSYQGQRIRSAQSIGTDTYMFETEPIPGAYLLQVESASGSTSIKFILTR